MFIQKSMILLTLMILFTGCTAKNIVSLNELNQAIKNGPNRKIGFLSQGNFYTVQNELNKLVEPKYYQNTDELHTAVNSGNILAGLVSGTPKDTFELNIFGSEQISIRSMMVNQNNHLILAALDAAIVRIIERGQVEQIAEQNKPYQALVVHSCKPSSNHFDWPELGNRTKIKIAALGPYQWGGTDGDYTKKPFIGFWPDYYNAIENEFIKKYNITFERIWFKTSKEVLDSILIGETDTTEPYMMIGSAYNDYSRKTSFDMSCITSATQDKYFTKRILSKEKTIQVNNPVLLIVSITLGVLFIVIAILLFIMYVKERNGNPLFHKPLLTPIDPSSAIDNHHL